MTLPLDAVPTPVEPVRCEGIRRSGLRCNRWLRDAESVSARMGPDCRERARLIPPRRHRFAVVESAATGTPLFEINEGGPDVTDHARNTIPGWEGSVGPFPGQYCKPHVYARDIHSGAGNCVCGQPVGHSRHVQAAPGVPVPDEMRPA